MALAARNQSGCSTDVENNHLYTRGQPGLPRNRLGNRNKKPILSDYKQNQIAPKPLNPTQRVAVNEISKSTPDLSRVTSNIRPKIISAASVAKNMQKIRSWETLAKPKKAPPQPVKVQHSSRIPKKPITLDKCKPVADFIKKPERIEIGKKVTLDKTRTQKPAENKRKLNCLESGAAGHSKQTKGEELLSPAGYPYPLSPSKNRIEECTKIVKKIMLDKKMVEIADKKRNSSEFEDSIGTLNSDEIVDFLLNDSQIKLVESARTSSELDKSSKRNSSEFDGSIGSFFSDQIGLNNSNEFLNAASSKQSFFNDNPFGLSVSEELDNLTPGLSDLSNAVDRTPSAEDLPMECEAELESANSTLPGPETNASARSTSPAEELPQESLSSRTPNAAVSIITSITSIMSLDTGYQGDGELSRPESRNTENESRLLKLPIAENGIPVKAINFDDGKTMTDSDFFTESDADVHDDLSAAAAEIGSGKGDRKAQVIDGTLYGGGFIQTHGSQRHDNEPSSTVPDQLNRIALAGNNSNEDMESSGIYSDLEKKPEDITGKEKEPFSYLGMITEQMKTIQSLALCVAERKFRQESLAEGMTKSSSAESSSTVQEVVSTKATPTSLKSIENTLSDRKESTVKKAKTPNRNVTSKIKALIESPSCEIEGRTKTVKKGKWDAVMDKIAQGRKENNYTPSKFRDIKSKVFQNVGPLFSSRKGEQSPKTPPRASPSSQLKSRSRRSTRVRSSESSLVSPKSKLSRTSNSPNSSQRSSLSDISLSGNPHQKSSNRTSKKRDSISPQSNESTNSANTPTRKLNNNDDSISTANRVTASRNSDLQNGNVIQMPSSTALLTMKTPSVRKTPTPRRNEATAQTPTLHRTASVPLKDSNHNGIVSKTGSTVIISNSVQNGNSKAKTVQSFQNKSLKTASRGANPIQVKNGCLLAVAKETNKALLKQLKYNSKAFESLAILFSYCTNDLDAFSTPHLKQKLETEKEKFMQVQSQLEELNMRFLQAREEICDKDHVIAELQKEKISLGEESETFKRIVEELEVRLKAATEQKHEAESELMRECENIRSLRRVLSDRTDKYESEKDSLVNSLTEIKKENGILKSANREIKEEYNKCLVENQRLVELISKRQNEVSRLGKENQVESGDGVRLRAGRSSERSPSRVTNSPGGDRASRGTSSCLESEVESLRQVLALKTDEVTELRRQELSLREKADRVPKLVSTITMLEGKVEDIQTQLSSQTETVRDLYKSNEHLEEELKSVNIQKTRLMHKNEELQYKLKQYAEAMKQLATQKNLSEKNIKADLSLVKTNSRKNDVSLDDSLKSQMKAVVEKSDSVSYMLEMTEDSSEIVKNIIRRAESLRSTSRDHMLPKKKRSKASSVSFTDTGSAKRNSSIDDDFMPDAMSTSISSPNDFEFERHMSKDKNHFSTPFVGKKAVKLSQNDFSTDSIELPHDNDCEVIEITKSFDKADKNGEMVTSTSSSSSSSSNGSHFDIESDVFSNLYNEQNIHELDEDTESSEFQDNGSIIRTFRRETTENIMPVLPVYTDLEDGSEGHSVAEENYLSTSKNFVKIPKVSGGEAMVGLSSDDEEIRLCNE